MHDHTDLFAFPELSDDAVVACDQFLEYLYAAFQNRYFTQLRRHYYHEHVPPPPDDQQLQLPLDPPF